ncbi:PHP domain-containing protein [Phormidium sp. CLA17]|uniref:PHP domain-containing protein n=2 Tax=Leptolyngbya sp. Cla-17 TaxID=2803751 RepID=UPI0014908D2B|nr:PHP domain-containing protein [Leptolyngbya sp. Cla-17]MBM0743693.1 PHP domain-containing protein [Leptolyngbya sp. Cla-17]
MAVVNLVEESVSSKPTAQDTLALRGVFETIHAESCPTSFNFHMHTVCSDGQLQPEKLMEQAIAIGLQGFAITDHHTVDGYQRAQCWLADYIQANPDRVDNLPHLWTGIEITSRLLETEVHILGYAFDVAHSAMEPYVQKCAPQDEIASAAQVIASIQMAGGLAVLAHPVRYRRSPEDLIAAAATLGINGVETYYAYDNPSPWRTSPRQTEQVQRLSSTYGLLNTCGSDTHGLSLLQRL